MTPTFYLGTHEPSWLRRTRVPLFLSRRRLARQKRWPRALGPWALDSGGFSELSIYGAWLTTPAHYIDEVRTWAGQIGNLEWAAVQDWMCEPIILKKTGLTVAQHQENTITSYITLMSAAPELPWTPVLQGWTHADYLDHVDQYAARGINLTELPRVGLGSICRRQATTETERLIRQLASYGLKLHGFGMKTLGLANVADAITSADSMAWSFHARKNPPLPECRHPRCANCLPFALKWRAAVLTTLTPKARQPWLL